jgi:hypothetical protein
MSRPSDDAKSRPPLDDDTSRFTVGAYAASTLTNTDQTSRPPDVIKKQTTTGRRYQQPVSKVAINAIGWRHHWTARQEQTDIVGFGQVFDWHVWTLFRKHPSPTPHPHKNYLFSSALENNIGNLCRCSGARQKYTAAKPHVCKTGNVIDKFIILTMNTLLCIILTEGTARNEFVKM